jgi:hypothetical protein
VRPWAAHHQAWRHSRAYEHLRDRPSPRTPTHRRAWRHSRAYEHLRDRPSPKRRRTPQACRVLRLYNGVRDRLGLRVARAAGTPQRPPDPSMPPFTPARSPQGPVAKRARAPTAASSRPSSPCRAPRRRRPGARCARAAHGRGFVRLAAQCQSRGSAGTGSAQTTPALSAPPPEATSVRRCCRSPNAAISTMRTASSRPRATMGELAARRPRRRVDTRERERANSPLIAGPLSKSPLLRRRHDEGRTARGESREQEASCPSTCC